MSIRLNEADLPEIGTIIERYGFAYRITKLDGGYFAKAVVERCHRGDGLKVGQSVAIPYGVLMADWNGGDGE